MPAIFVHPADIQISPDGSLTYEVRHGTAVGGLSVMPLDQDPDPMNGVCSNSTCSGNGNSSCMNSTCSKKNPTGQ